MGLFSFFRGPDIDAGVQRFHETKNAVLLDVRAPEEFHEGHIPDAVNLPLNTIDRKTAARYDRETPLFVYCLSGARSARAAAALKSIGYSNVSDIGGIGGYHGKLVR